MFVLFTIKQIWLSVLAKILVFKRRHVSGNVKEKRVQRGEAVGDISLSKHSQNKPKLKKIVRIAYYYMVINIYL